MQEFDSYNDHKITVMKLDEDTHLYQLTMDLNNRPANYPTAQKKLDELKNSGAIIEIEKISSRGLEITRGPGHDWQQLDDELIKALIMGTTGPVDDVGVKFDHRLGRENFQVRIYTDAHKVRHYKVLEPVNA